MIYKEHECTKTAAVGTEERVTDYLTDCSSVKSRVKNPQAVN
jgi:hypothetical protein